MHDQGWAYVLSIQIQWLELLIVSRFDKVSDDNSPFHGGTSFESIKSKKLSCKSDTFIRITLLSITLGTNCVDKLLNLVLNHLVDITSFSLVLLITRHRVDTFT